MTLIVRTPSAACTLAGANAGTVLTARCSFGFDLRVSEAYITLPTAPTFGTYLDTVDLAIGATPQTTVVRFSGLLLEYDFDLFPGACTLVCRGNLYRALIYENPVLGGVDMTAVGGVSGAGQTDQDMVNQVLGSVPDLNFSSGHIGGTGKLLGTTAFSDVGPNGEFTGPFAWGGPSPYNAAQQNGGFSNGSSVGETALAFIERLDSISEGFRVFETLAGDIYRFQIYSR